MRYATPAILLLATALLGGCLTLQPPTITTNSVSNPDVGRKGFSFPVPPGYQASTPEEFQQLMDDAAASFSRSYTEGLEELLQANSQGGQSVFIYRKEALESGHPYTIVVFSYRLESDYVPFERYPAIREQILIKSANRYAYDIEGKDNKILVSPELKTVNINGRPWIKIWTLTTNEELKNNRSSRYTMVTIGDLNDIYVFDSLTIAGKPSDGINIVDYLAEHMEI